MKTVVFAYHNYGCVGIRELLALGYEIQAVFTHKDNPSENIWFSSAAELAASEGIPVFAPEKINTRYWQDKIKDYSPDMIFSFYYRQILGGKILSIPSEGAFNLHGSLLPAYRGRCPVNWVLLKGEKETGVTIHKMLPKADTGAIIDREKVTIDDEDDALKLHGKMEDATEKLLRRCLPKLRDKTFEEIPQNQEEAFTMPGRGPGDGVIEWNQDALQVRNLVRAVAYPYPGAFSYFGSKKIVVRKAAPCDVETAGKMPGTVLSTHPFQVACGKGALEIIMGKVDDDAWQFGGQLAQTLGVVEGALLRKPLPLGGERPTRVLILGIDGFIGNKLATMLLDEGYEVFGIDLHGMRVKHLMSNPLFHFSEGDISVNREWVRYHVYKCDVVVPLVAIATPREYTRNPIGVFNLDFEENLRIIRDCVKYKKRIIFPSTSEVYGMCRDENFDEESSPLITGPIKNQRWIYSCCKQLLDRVIWAYGKHEGLEFTLFRPFNWVGPGLDTLDSARIGSSRVITQFILNLVEGTPILLVDGGKQKRCFLDIIDGVECLTRIIANKDKKCNGGIFNIGNPDAELSIRELAEITIDYFRKHPLVGEFPPLAGMKVIESRDYYGEGYQDITRRKPKIDRAQKILGWKPQIPVRDSIAKTIDSFLQEAAEMKKRGKA